MLSLFFAAAFAVSNHSFAASSAELDPSNAELLKQMQALTAKVNQLEKKLAEYQKNSPPPAERPAKSGAKVVKTQDSQTSEDDQAGSATAIAQDSSAAKTPLFGLGYRSNATLSIGAYGELKFGGQEAPGGWKDGFDAGRIVLLPTFQITDNIIFNAEIEFEHGGIADDDDDKLTGSVDIEQAYIDFKFNEHFNWRAPGVDVVPFGFINLFHEPTQFYSVQRPELDNGLIPTTWFEGSTSIYGKIVDNLNYQFQVNTGLEDIGQNGGVPKGPMMPASRARKRSALSRNPIGDFNQTKNAPGFRFAPELHSALRAGVSGKHKRLLHFQCDAARRPCG